VPSWRVAPRLAMPDVVVAWLVTGFPVRDSMVPDGPKLMITAPVWRRFADGLKAATRLTLSPRHKRLPERPARPEGDSRAALTPLPSTRCYEAVTDQFCREPVVEPLRVVLVTIG
jgi:hypothetical protein